MASQSYIIALTAELHKATLIAGNAKRAHQYERDISGDSQTYKENLEVWLELRDQAEKLRKELDTMVQSMSDLDDHPPYILHLENARAGLAGGQQWETITTPNMQSVFDNRPNAVRQASHLARYFGRRIRISTLTKPQVYVTINGSVINA